MCALERTVAVTDSPNLAAMVSLFYGAPGLFFALIEAPRLMRPDAGREIVERCNTMRLYEPTEILLLGLSESDKRRIAPSFGELGKCIVLDSVEQVVSYLSSEKRFDPRLRDPSLLNPYLVDIMRGLDCPNEIRVYADRAGRNPRHPSASGIVSAESGVTLSSVVAANYAWSHGYDFRALGPAPRLTPEFVDGLVADVDAAIAAASPATPQIDRLLAEMAIATDQIGPWPNAVPLCFFTRAAPYGLLFPKNPTSHVLELEAGLNTAMSVGWSEFERRHGKGPGHVTLFVDPQWPDITSETEEIIGNLGTIPVFVQRVTGAHATCEAFRLHANHFPYDILYVSSHGQAPSYRWCRHVFTAADGAEHEIQTHEFEYFAPHGEEVAVTQKTYPLSVDGVPWHDKKALALKKGGKIFEEFILTESAPRIPKEFKWVKNARVEGIALRDGVFFGPLYALAASGHPIVVLNCCSLWTSMAIQVMHARARAYIATLWSVGDASAVAYGTSFYSAIMKDSVINAAWVASRGVQDSVSSSAYVCLSWPHVQLRESDPNHKHTITEVLADRLQRHFWGLADTLATGSIPSEVFVVLEFLVSTLNGLTAHTDVGAAQGDRRRSPTSRMDSTLRELRARVSAE